MSVYVPGHFAARDPAAVARLVHDHSFATLLTPAQPEPLVTHLPLILIADREPHGTLLGHFARANPHAQHVHDAESIAIFQGPHAYVSPSWYAEPSAGVPTWNYAVVHIHGTIELDRDPGATRAVLDALIARFESGRATPWTLALDQRRRDAMLGAIIGFRLPIKRIDAKFKLSQNRTPGERARVATALDCEGYADATATAAWMRAYAGAGSDGTT